MRFLICGILCLAMLAPNSDQKFLDALMTLPTLGGQKVSPDGRYVAWTWYHTGPAADVYVAPSDGSAEPTRLTVSTDDTTLVSWAPDSKSVLVERDNDGDERYQLFQVALDTPNKLQRLTQAKPDFYLHGGQLHPNGHWLVYGANYDFATKKEIEQTCVIRQDLSNGEIKTLATPVKPAYSLPWLNKQGTHILYERVDLNPSGQQIWLVDIDGKNDREILNFGADKKVEASWFPDGERILFIAEDKNYRKVGIFGRIDNSITWLVNDPTRNIENAHAPDRTSDVAIGEIIHARDLWTLMNLQTKNERPIRAASGTIRPLAPTDSSGWVMERYSATNPGELFFAKDPLDTSENGVRGSITRTWTRTVLKPTDLAAAKEYSWKSVDGMAMHGFLYRAVDPKGTIVIVHGGPTGNDEDIFDAQVQYLVANGFNVFNPNYRGSTGYGLEFMDAIKIEGWGGKEQDDIRTGIESLIRDGIAEKGKVGITGTSYGGYSSWYAITHFPTEIIAAAAPICGMTDLVVDYQTTRPDLRPYSEEMMGGSPDKVPKRYFERSPIHFVKNIKGKLLIVQGGQDPNVTPENVKQVEKELKKNDIPYQVLLFPDEGHGIYKPENERKLFVRLSEFFTSAFSS
jgi:dipeptidyl aminopeptidase/acylaminoacyl peptidase